MLINKRNLIMSDLHAARRNLDLRLAPLRDRVALRAPPKGWIRALRQALGMTTAQLACRMGVSQPRVVELEQSEASHNLTLRSLARAAEALDCTLVYALVPKVSLDQRMHQQATHIVAKHMQATAHSMRLEAQGTAADAQARDLNALVETLINTKPSRLWEAE